MPFVFSLKNFFSLTVDNFFFQKKERNSAITINLNFDIGIKLALVFR
jgi:hypothetical protein